MKNASRKEILIRGGFINNFYSPDNNSIQLTFFFQCNVPLSYITFVRYSAGPVFNATSYRWQFPEWTSGVGEGADVMVSFEKEFRSDTLKVYAINNGFGESLPACLEIVAESANHSNSFLSDKGMTKNQISLDEYGFIISDISNPGKYIQLSVFDISGKKIAGEVFLQTEGIKTITLPCELGRGNVFFLKVSSDVNEQIYKIFKSD